MADIALNGASEALSLRDPEGNGVERDRDRLQAEWPRDDAGDLAMTTGRLDLADLRAKG